MDNEDPEVRKLKLQEKLKQWDAEAREAIEREIKDPVIKDPVIKDAVLDNAEYKRQLLEDIDCSDRGDDYQEDISKAQALIKEVEQFQEQYEEEQARRNKGSIWYGFAALILIVSFIMVIVLMGMDYSRLSQK